MDSVEKMGGNLSWASFDDGLPPGDLAEVEVPVGPIGHAQRAGFLTVDDLVEVHRGRENVDQHFTADGRNDPGPNLGTASELKRGRVNGKHMAHDTDESLGVGFDRTNEMTMGFELEMPALDQVNLFARGHDRNLHAEDGTGTTVSTGIRIRARAPEGEVQIYSSFPKETGRFRKIRSIA